MRAVLKIGAVVLAAATAVAGAAGQAAAAGPSAVATPATDLVDGQTIRVDVTGFPAESGLEFIQCALLRESEFRCGVARPAAVADATGAASADLVVQSTFPSVDLVTGEPAGVVDCATAQGGCGVGAVTADRQQLARTPVAFR